MAASIAELCRKALDKGADAAFVTYLHDGITERIDSGRSFDCDEYRALEELANTCECYGFVSCPYPICGKREA
jgi:hypothetical protein